MRTSFSELTAIDRQGAHVINALPAGHGRRAFGALIRDVRGRRPWHRRERGLLGLGGRRRRACDIHGTRSPHLSMTSGAPDTSSPQDRRWAAREAAGVEGQRPRAPVGSGRPTGQRPRAALSTPPQARLRTAMRRFFAILLVARAAVEAGCRMLMLLPRALGRSRLCGRGVLGGAGVCRCAGPPKRSQQSRSAVAAARPPSQARAPRGARCLPEGVDYPPRCLRGPSRWSECMLPSSANAGLRSPSTCTADASRDGRVPQTARRWRALAVGSFGDDVGTKHWLRGRDDAPPRCWPLGAGR